MSGKIIMIGSMKGGVSKTVTTFNLAYSLSKLGRKVLAVDFDSQANLSTCSGCIDAFEKAWAEYERERSRTEACKSS